MFFWFQINLGEDLWEAESNFSTTVTRNVKVHFDGGAEALHSGAPQSTVFGWSPRESLV